MANKSKEAERQNKALQDIISGREHEKDYIQVGYTPEAEEAVSKLVLPNCCGFSIIPIRANWFPVGKSGLVISLFSILEYTRTLFAPSSLYMSAP